jgi:hypothetical protein
MSYIYGAAANAIKWQMGFNSAFKGLMKYLREKIRIMPQEWNSAYICPVCKKGDKRIVTVNPYPTNVEYRVSSQ